MAKNKDITVNYPIELESNEKDAFLYGYFHKSTNFYNIVKFESTQTETNLEFLGKFLMNKSEPLIDGLIYGFIENNKINFTTGKGEKCVYFPYSSYIDIFSRNSGILESAVMKDKCAIIAGCGSVGSLVALELARSGVGKFVLIDNDIFAYHNICRHQCVISDVGKYKVDAVKERILQINPNAIVEALPTIIERVPKEIFDLYCIPNQSILIGCGDNRESDLYSDEISYLMNIPFISIGFWERAYAGEIFYTVPNKLPRYKKLYENIGDMSGRKSQNHRFYTNEEDLEKVSFEPGISVDINFVTIVAIKLIIDLLNINNDTYIPKLVNNLTQFTLVCNSNNPLIGGPNAEIFSYPLQITTSIEIS